MPSFAEVMVETHQALLHYPLMAYKRVLLKLSGEQLAGGTDGGFDPGRGAWLANEVKKAVGNDVQVVIIIGGGNIVRGATTAGNGIRRVTADHMGMLSTMINGLALTDIFEANGIQTRCLSNIFAEQVAENYSFRLADKHLENGRVVIVVGGVGRPYFTTDTGSVNLALELGCDVVLKSTKVDGVYDKDPTKYPDAVKFDRLDYQQAVENPNIMVMDKAAMGLAMEHKIPVIIFEVDKPDNIAKAIAGEAVGTVIS